MMSEKPIPRSRIESLFSTKEEDNQSEVITHKSSLKKRESGILNINSNLDLSGAQSVWDLTGLWNCDDGGKYYIRQMGNMIWWYGEATPTSPGWSNVMYGTISGDTIKGNWADVPKGSTMNNGIMVLNIESNRRLNIISKTVGFGGSLWTR